MKAEREANRLSVLLCCLMMGAVYTVSTYTFGTKNHVSDLPITLRMLDSSYLTHDFYVNVASEVGPRTVFSGLMAGLSLLMGVEWSYAIVTLLANAAIAWVSWEAGKRWLGTELSGAAAASVVMTMSTFDLGYQWVIPASHLQPSLIAKPLMFYGLVACLDGKIRQAVAACLVASLLHPTMGLEAAGLVLGLSALGALRHGDGWRDVIGGGVATAVVAGGWAILLSGSHVSTETYLAIESHFRHAHHVIPSTFDPLDYQLGAVFLVALGGAIVAWRRLRPQTRGVEGAVALVVALLVLCIVGYVFVEVVPVLLVAVARTFRLLILVKWMGLALFGALAGRLGWPGVVGLFVVSGVLYGVGHEVHLAMLALCLLAGMAVVTLKRGSWGPPIVAAALWVLGVGVPDVGIRLDATERWIDENLPEDAVLLVPPRGGELRLTAKRALVVDGKAFPFNGDGMKEWYRRMEDCYGPIPAGGLFDVMGELNRNYVTRGDQKWQVLAEIYGATHGVLPKNARTKLDVLHRGRKFKVVAFPD